MDGSGDRQNIFPTGDGETGNPSAVNGRNPTAMVNNEEWDLDKLDYKLYILLLSFVPFSALYYEQNVSRSTFL